MAVHFNSPTTYLASKQERPAHLWLVREAQSSSAPRASSQTRTSDMEKVYLRRRILVGVIVGLLLALVLVLLRGGVSSSAAGSGNRIGGDRIELAAASTYQVKYGDTLWTVATGMNLDIDTREVVARLSEANGGSNLMVGQELKIPTDLLAQAGS